MPWNGRMDFQTGVQYKEGHSRLMMARDRGLAPSVVHLRNQSFVGAMRWIAFVSGITFSPFFETSFYHCITQLHLYEVK